MLHFVTKQILKFNKMQRHRQKVTQV